MLHKELEKPKVGFVGLSNWRLDSAKMNRCILHEVIPLTSGDNNDQDLIDTINTMNRQGPGGRELPSQWSNRYSHEIVHFYKQIIKSQEPDDTKIFDKTEHTIKYGYSPTKLNEPGPFNFSFYGDRDFYHLVGYVKYRFNYCLGCKLNDELILESIFRNFGGMTEYQQGKLMQMIDATMRFNVSDIGQNMFKKYSALRSIRDNIEQTKSIKQRGIGYDMRHILLISECDVIWKVLFCTNILNSRNSYVIFGSKFRDDQGSSLYMHKNIQKIKNCMSNGQNIVLLHLDSVYDSLYDVLNQRYITNSRETRYCNIAIHSSELLCQIDPAFRIVIVMPRRDVHHENPDKSKHTPVAFLNRLEKQYLNVSDLCGLNPYWDVMEKRLESAINEIFSTFFSGQANYCHVFAGFLKNFTFKSLLLCAETKFNLVNVDEKNKDEIIGNVIDWCIGELLLNTYLRYFVEYDGSLMYDKLPSETSCRPFNDILHVLETFISKKMNDSRATTLQVKDSVDVKTFEQDKDDKIHSEDNVVLIRITTHDHFHERNDFSKDYNIISQKMVEANEIRSQKKKRDLVLIDTNYFDTENDFDAFLHAFFTSQYYHSLIIQYNHKNKDEMLHCLHIQQLVEEARTKYKLGHHVIKTVAVLIYMNRLAGIHAENAMYIGNEGEYFDFIQDHQYPLIFDTDWQQVYLDSVLPHKVNVANFNVHDISSREIFSNLVSNYTKDGAIDTFKVALNHIEFGSLTQIKQEMNRIINLFHSNFNLKFQAAVVQKLGQQLNGTGYPVSVVDQLLTSILKVQSQDAAASRWSRISYSDQSSPSQRNSTVGRGEISQRRLLLQRGSFRQCLIEALELQLKLGLINIILLMFNHGSSVLFTSDQRKSKQQIASNDAWLKLFKSGRIVVINASALALDVGGSRFLAQSSRLGQFDVKFDMYCQFPFALYIDRFITRQRGKILEHQTECKEIVFEIGKYLESWECEDLITLEHGVKDRFLKDVACIELKRIFGASYSCLCPNPVRDLRRAAFTDYYMAMIEFIQKFIECGIRPIEIRSTQSRNNQLHNGRPGDDDDDDDEKHSGAYECDTDIDSELIEIEKIKPLGSIQSLAQSVTLQTQRSIEYCAKEDTDDDDEGDEFHDSSYDDYGVFVTQDADQTANGNLISATNNMITVQNLDILNKIDHSSVRIYEIYGVLWYYQELLHHLCKVISIFENNVHKLNDINKKWDDAIAKAVDNPNGLLNGVIDAMDSVIKFLLDCFRETSGYGATSKMDQNVKLIVIAQNEIDACLEWIKENASQCDDSIAIHESKKLDAKWKLVRLHLMIFSSYQNRIESETNRNTITDDIESLQQCVRKFYNGFAQQNGKKNKIQRRNIDPSSKVRFDSERAILQLDKLHRDICKNVTAIKDTEVDVFHYILQQYISLFAFPNEIEIRKNDTNVNIEFVLYLCDVMSNYVRLNTNGDDDEDVHVQQRVRIDTSGNKYTLQLIAEKVLIVFKKEQVAFKENEKHLRLVTNRLNEILDKESNNDYSSSALALLIAEETYQHNNAQYLQQTRVATFKQIKNSKVAKKLEQTAAQSLCHQIVAVGTAKVLVSHLIEKWDKILQKDKDAQARYRNILTRLFQRKQGSKMPETLINLKRGLGYYFFSEYCRKYGWYNGKHDWIEQKDIQNKPLLERIGLKAMIDDCPQVNQDMKTYLDKKNNVWLKDNVFRVLWSDDNKNTYDDKENIFALSMKNDNFMCKLDTEIFESIDTNRQIRIQANELENKHLIGLISSVFNHSFLMDAWVRKGGDSTVSDTDKLMDQCRKHLNNEIFSKYSASIKENLLYGKGDNTFRCSWNENQSKETVFNKQLIRLAIHLFGVCISIGSNPFSRLLNIPYSNMNDEFIIGMPDNHNSKTGQPGDSLFLCNESKHLFFKSQRKIRVETRRNKTSIIKCDECSSDSIEVGKMASGNGELKMNNTHGLDRHNLVWIKQKVAENYYDNMVSLRGYVLSRKENVSDEGAQRQLSELGVYMMRLFVHLILWMYNVHYRTDKERKTINSIKYFLCNVDTPVRKSRGGVSDLSFAIENKNKNTNKNKNKNKNKQQYPKELESTRNININASVDLKRQIWDMTDEELSKWLLENEIKFYFKLIKKELMRSDEDTLYVLHTIIDRFYRTWDDSFKKGYNIDDSHVQTTDEFFKYMEMQLSKNRQYVKKKRSAKDNKKIVKQVAIIQNSLIMRDKCENYFINQCINPVLLNLNQCIRHMRDISGDDQFIKFWNEKSNYQRLNFLSDLRLQSKYYAYLWLPYKKINLSQFCLHLEKEKEKEDEYKDNESKYSVTYGLLSSLNDQQCGNMLFYFQYLPQMIKWIKFVHSRLNGRLSKRDFQSRDKQNPFFYQYNAEWLLDDCANDIINGGKDVAVENHNALRGFVRIWNFFARLRMNNNANVYTHDTDNDESEDYKDDDDEYEDSGISFGGVSKKVSTTLQLFSATTSLETENSVIRKERKAQIESVLTETDYSMSETDKFREWPILSMDNLKDIPLIYCICSDIDETASEFGGQKGIDTLMDDVIGHGGDNSSKVVHKNISRLEVILDRIVSVSNNVLQLCVQSAAGGLVNVSNVSYVPHELKQDSNDFGSCSYVSSAYRHDIVFDIDDENNVSNDNSNGIFLSHIEKQSDVIDIDESDLQNRVQKCTPQQGLGLSTNGNGEMDMDNYVNKPLLEADLIKRYIIGRKLIVNDCNKIQNENVVINGIANTRENNVFNFRFLGGMVSIRQSVQKIQQIYSQTKLRNTDSIESHGSLPLITNASSTNSMTATNVSSFPYFESMNSETLNRFIEIVRISRIRLRGGGAPIATAPIEKNDTSDIGGVADFGFKFRMLSRTESNKEKSEKTALIETCESYKSGIEQTILRLERMSVLPSKNKSLHDFMMKELKFNENQRCLFAYNDAIKQNIQLKHCLHLWDVFSYLIKVSNQQKWDACWMTKHIKPKLAKYYMGELNGENNDNIKTSIRYLFESREIGDMQVFEFILDFRYFIIQKCIKDNIGKALTSPDFSQPISSTQMFVSLMECFKAWNPYYTQRNKELLGHVSEKWKKISLSNTFDTYVAIVDIYQKLRATL